MCQVFFKQFFHVQKICNKIFAQRNALELLAKISHMAKKMNPAPDSKSSPLTSNGGHGRMLETEGWYGGIQWNQT